MEIIKDVKGYEGLYKVTSWGRVISVATGKPLGMEATPKGYLRVKLKKDGVYKNHKVHRLVAQAFIENANGYPQVNHIDGNKTNNSISNLEWVTDEQNKVHQKTIMALIIKA